MIALTKPGNLIVKIEKVITENFASNPDEPVQVVHRLMGGLIARDNLICINMQDTENVEGNRIQIKGHEEVAVDFTDPDNLLITHMHTTTKKGITKQFVYAEGKKSFRNIANNKLNLKLPSTVDVLETFYSLGDSDVYIAWKYDTFLDEHTFNDKKELIVTPVLFSTTTYEITAKAV